MGNRQLPGYLNVFLLRPALPMLKFGPDIFSWQDDEIHEDKAKPAVRISGME